MFNYRSEGRRAMRIAVAGAGAFGVRHLDGLANIDGVEVTVVVSRRLEQAQEVAEKFGVAHASTDLEGTFGREDVDAVILCTPTQMHAAQAIGAMRGRQARTGRDTSGRQLGRRSGGRPRPATDRACLHGRPHPPFQPVAPVAPSADSRRRALHIADGRADLLLPPHEHERAGRAAKLDRQPSLASRRAHRRHLPVPDRRRCGGGKRGAGSRSTNNSGSRWTCRCSYSPVRARSARCR